jgi:hypothetical protein
VDKRSMDGMQVVNIRLHLFRIRLAAFEGTFDAVNLIPQAVHSLQKWRLVNDDDLEILTE